MHQPSQVKTLKRGAGVVPQQSGLLDDLEEASHHGLHSCKELNSANNLKELGSKSFPSCSDETADRPRGTLKKSTQRSHTLTVGCNKYMFF